MVVESRVTAVVSPLPFNPTHLHPYALPRLKPSLSSFTLVLALLGVVVRAALKSRVLSPRSVTRRHNRGIRCLRLPLLRSGWIGAVEHPQEEGGTLITAGLGCALITIPG